jgi:peroxiredoxin
MKLSEQIADLQQIMMKDIPLTVIESLLEEKIRLLAKKPEDSALNTGDIIPPIKLYNHKGQAVDLQSMLREKDLVISFYRGTWCPYCSLELRALLEYYPDICNAGAELVAISPELPDKSMESIEREKIPFQILSDPGNRIAKEFGLTFQLSAVLQEIYRNFGFDLVEKNGDLNWRLPMPATYIVRQDGRIHFAYVNSDYTQRMEPADIVEQLKNLNVSA